MKYEDVWKREDKKLVYITLEIFIEFSHLSWWTIFENVHSVYSCEFY